MMKRFGPLVKLAEDTQSKATNVVEWLIHNKILAVELNFEEILKHFYTALGTPRSNLMAYDIGAHNGMHSAPLSKIYTKLVCVEPLPTQYGRLKTMFSSSAHVSVYNLALSHTSGKASFTVNEGSLAESGLKERIYNNPASVNLTKINVNVSTLDELHLETVKNTKETVNTPPKIGYIKIDAEGGEIDILKGGKNILTNDRPILSVEYGSPSYSAYGLTGSSLRDIAHQYDYQVWDIFGWNIDTDDVYKKCMDNYYWDYFLIPSEDLTAAKIMERARISLMQNFEQFFLNPPQVENKLPVRFSKIFDTTK